MIVYPPQFRDEIIKIWNTFFVDIDEKPPLPEMEIIDKILEVCYISSMMTEESRKLRFQVVFCKKNISADDCQGGDYVGNFKTIFKHPRPFNSKELLRLAPATDPKRVLICVDSNTSNGELLIWGLIDSGLTWWKMNHGELDYGFPPPSAFTVSSEDPGDLTISTGGVAVIKIQHGEISKPIYYLGNFGPVSDFFKKPIKKLNDEVKKMLKKNNPKLLTLEGVDTQLHYLSFFDRVISKIQENSHGGSIIIIPHDFSFKLNEFFNVKYLCHHQRFWKLLTQSFVFSYLHEDLEDLHSRSLNEIKENPTKDDINNLIQLRVKKYESMDGLTDSVNFLASLAGVDGAIVITDNLELIGFGAEIKSNRSKLKFVQVAENKEGTVRRKLSIEQHGTRHRSAFRLCDVVSDSVVFVVSQDGGTTAVKKVKNKVVIWKDFQLTDTDH